jgi:hypothetical protein
MMPPDGQESLVSHTVTPRDITPAAGLPVLPPGHPRLWRLPDDLVASIRPENRLSFEVIAFTADCPDCGRDATWVEERDGQAVLEPVIACGHCDQDVRRAS